MSRWIGLSVLSVVELGELVYRIVWHYFQQIKNQRNDRIIPIINTMDNVQNRI
jgi:hypothetical protein